MKIHKFLFKKQYPNETFDDDDFADIVMFFMSCAIAVLVLLYSIIKWLSR
jgi:hypothetical protein